MSDHVHPPAGDDDVYVYCPECNSTNLREMGAVLDAWQDEEIGESYQCLDCGHFFNDMDDEDADVDQYDDTDDPDLADYGDPADSDDPIIL